MLYTRTRYVGQRTDFGSSYDGRSQALEGVYCFMVFCLQHAEFSTWIVRYGYCKCVDLLIDVQRRCYACCA